jgi:hypothetical protein
MADNIDALLSKYKAIGDDSSGSIDKLISKYGADSSSPSLGSQAKGLLVGAGNELSGGMMPAAQAALASRADSDEVLDMDPFPSAVAGDRIDKTSGFGANKDYAYQKALADQAMKSVKEEAPTAYTVGSYLPDAAALAAGGAGLLKKVPTGVITNAGHALANPSILTKVKGLLKNPMIEKGLIMGLPTAAAYLFGSHSGSHGGE